MISVKGKTKVAFIFSDPRLAPWHGGIFLRLSMIPRSHENDLKTAKMWHGKRSQSKKGHGNSSTAAEASQTSTEIHLFLMISYKIWSWAFLNKTPKTNYFSLRGFEQGFWFMWETATHNNNWANCQLGGSPQDFFTPRETFAKVPIF